MANINKTIINNLSVLLDYFINEQKIVFRRIDLFAGDMFYDNLFFDVCEVIYQYYSKVEHRQYEIKRRLFMSVSRYNRIFNFSLVIVVLYKTIIKLKNLMNIKLNLMIFVLI
mgnify:CR=1 FL=1